MKWYWFLFFNLINLALFADAGFSIQRRKQVSITSFTGLEHLKTHKLIYRTGYYQNSSDTRAYANKGMILNDGSVISIQEGGRRWEESDRNIDLILVDTFTGKTDDSIRLYAKDFNMHLIIAGEKDGKLQYTIDSTRAVYQYQVLNEEEKEATFKRNRIIYIACSVLGFLLLAGMFVYQKNKNKTIK